MNFGQTLVADLQTSKLMQPSQSALHNPTGFAEAAAVRGQLSRNLAANTAFSKHLPMCSRVVGPIALNAVGSTAWAASFAAHWRNAFNQWQQLRQVMIVGSRQDDVQRDALRFGDDVVLRTRLTAIGWVRSSFFPPYAARTEELSTTARDRSSLSTSRNLLSNTSWMRCHSPRSCHARSLRQHVIPDPQPISCGSMFQGIPLRSTYTMPVSACRFEIGLRPAYRLRRCFGGGSSGSISVHSSSSRIGLATSGALLLQCRRSAPYRSSAKSTSRLAHFVTGSKSLTQMKRGARSRHDRKVQARVHRSRSWCRAAAPVDRVSQESHAGAGRMQVI